MDHQLIRRSQYNTFNSFVITTINDTYNIDMNCPFPVSEIRFHLSYSGNSTGQPNILLVVNGIQNLPVIGSVSCITAKDGTTHLYGSGIGDNTINVLFKERQLFKSVYQMSLRSVGGVAFGATAIQCLLRVEFLE